MGQVKDLEWKKKTNKNLQQKNRTQKKHHNEDTCSQTRHVNITDVMNRNYVCKPEKYNELNGQPQDRYPCPVATAVYSLGIPSTAATAATDYQ
jgi:hypothetical protein